MKLNHYDVLGVSPDATQEEIRKAYRRRASELHPDRHTHKGEEDVRLATAAVAEVNEAWRILRDPFARQVYDSNLHRDRALSRAFKGRSGFDWFSGPLILLYLTLGLVLGRLVLVIGHEAIEVKLLWALAVIAVAGGGILLWRVLRDMSQ